MNLYLGFESLKTTPAFEYQTGTFNTFERILQVHQHLSLLFHDHFFFCSHAH